MMEGERLKRVKDCVIEGDAVMIREAVDEALAAGIPPRTIIDEGLMAGMAVIGRQFRDNEIYVPDVILAAEAMKTALERLKPLVTKNRPGLQWKIVIGTVQNDLHDLGKMIVSCMFEAAGFEVVDLGVDVPPEQFITAVKVERPDILALSCTLTTTLSELKKVVGAVRALPLGAGLKIMVGGLSVTPGFARSIGADAYGFDADHAVLWALSLLQPKGRGK